jgi:hypothetical protein
MPLPLASGAARAHCLPMHRTRVLTALLLGPLPAQALPWDVPVRGALVFQRRTDELRVVSGAFRSISSWAIPTAEDGGHEWRFWQGAQGKAPAGFSEAGFDDSAWPRGRALFGGDANDPGRRTAWNTAELCLRTHVDLGRNKPKLALFVVHHDDDVRIWWNNRQVASEAGAGRDRLLTVTAEDLDAAFVRGDNLLCAQCVNTGGAQYLDVGLLLFSALPPGVKTPADLAQKYGVERSAAREVEGWFFGGFRPPPLLLQGELTQSQERVRMPPGDVRELGWYCGMDLSRGTTGFAYDVLVPRLYRLGDLQLKGRFEFADASGWQTADLQVKSLPELAA